MTITAHLTKSIRNKRNEQL